VRCFVIATFLGLCLATLVGRSAVALEAEGDPFLELIPPHRLDHAAVRLADGRVLITGGKTHPENQVLDTAEVFDPATLTFTALTARMTVPRMNHTSTLIASGPMAGKVLIAGGDVSASLEVFEPVSNTFTAISGQLTSRLAEHSAIFLPDTGKVFIAGDTDKADVFDTASGTLRSIPLDTQRSKRAIARLPAGALLPDGSRAPPDSVLIIGGYHFWWAAPRDLIFDPRAEVAVTISDPGSTRIAPHVTTLRSGEVLIHGSNWCWFGDWSCTDDSSAEIFDPDTGTFRPTTSSLRYPGLETLIEGGPRDGDVLAIGRVGGEGEVYDPQSEIWTRLCRGLRAGIPEASTLTPLGDGKVLFMSPDYIHVVDAASLPPYVWEDENCDGFTDGCEGPDTTPPVIHELNPTRHVTCVSGEGGERLYYEAHVFDECDLEPTVTYAPPLGTLLPLGTTRVVITATDRSGNSSSMTIEVVVGDTWAPELTAPEGPVVLSCANAALPDLTSAFDWCDPAPVVTCKPPVGTILKPGMTRVVATAIDTSGNSVTRTFDVIVPLEDEQPPVLIPTYGDVLVLPCAGKPLPDLVTAIDSCDPAPVVTYDPPVGTRLSPGTTRVVVTAVDASGNSATRSFDVIAPDVRDEEAPWVFVPDGEVFLPCEGVAGTSLPAFASAVDSCDPAPVITYEPPVGTLLPGGTTAVLVSATDAGGNTSSGRFDVTVMHYPEITDVAATPGILWPRDRRTVPVRVSCRVSVCGTVPEVSAFVSSSQPDRAGLWDTPGDVNGTDGYIAPVLVPPGQIEVDAEGQVSFTVNLRRETDTSRGGIIADRVYMVTILAGMAEPAVVRILVPHDSGVRATRGSGISGSTRIYDLGAPMDGTSYGAVVDGTGRAALGLIEPDEMTARAAIWENGRLTVLPTLGGARSWIIDMADDGTVVGDSELADGQTFRAYRWTQGVMSELDTLGGWWSSARAVNASGLIVGVAATPGEPYNEPYHAVLWTGTQARDLGTLAGASRNSWAQAINTKGAVAGGSEDENGSIAGFFWQDGIMIDLGNLGESYCHVADIDSSGRIAGNSATPEWYMHAFVWDQGIMRDLGTLGGLDSEAVDMNDAGQVVGSARRADGSIHAVLWDSGRTVDLGTLGGRDSYARRINSTGEIIGTSERTDGSWGSFRWRDGIMTEVGSLGGSYVNVADINDRGEVVGTSGTADGSFRAFLESPR
jgi:probable HAF family extracellular repeat protein